MTSNQKISLAKLWEKSVGAPPCKKVKIAFRRTKQEGNVPIMLYLDVAPNCSECNNFDKTNAHCYGTELWKYFPNMKTFIVESSTLAITKL